MEQVEIHKERLDRHIGTEDFAIAVVTATKPDFYKQAPIVTAAHRRGFPCFVLHTGQHHDELLGHGLREYGIDESVAVDLGIRGGLSQKTSELVQRIEQFASYLDDAHPETTVLPIVHGDTLAAGIVPQAWMFATNQLVAHNEAGLRSMSPSFAAHDDPDAFIEAQWEGDWTLNRTEPFPEQYDTFVGSAASHYHFAPTEVNREHLVREGYPATVEESDRVPVVGNSVVDAIQMKTETDDTESVFDIYPTLEARDEWIRVDIHRRANLLPDRFRAIIDCVIRLVENGHNVNFVELTATKAALQNYGLRDRLVRLSTEYENFLLTGLWKKHAHVYEFLRSGQCFAELTDSGSMQEELNHIDEALCLTARYNTDRPETVFEAGTNLLVPPTSGDAMYDLVSYVFEDGHLRDQMHDGPALYGENVGETIVEFLAQRRDEIPFEWAHERLGFTGSHQDFDYL
jgi:UDP-N-acetylglucosamine 2-epimerase